MTTKPSECHCRVTVDELAGRLGFNEHAEAAEAARANGFDFAAHVAPDWTGSPSVPAEVASEVLTGVLTAREQHDQRWRSYQAYLRERARKVREDEERAARERMEAERKRANTRNAQITAQRQRQVEAELASEREKARARAGSPVPFDQFEKR